MNKQALDIIFNFKIELFSKISLFLYENDSIKSFFRIGDVYMKSEFYRDNSFTNYDNGYLTLDLATSKLKEVYVYE